jgi:hypothetical protein
MSTEPEYMQGPNPTEPELLLPKLVKRCKLNLHVFRNID